MKYPKPSFSITEEALELSLEIANLLGRLQGTGGRSSHPHLRKQNQVKTIHGSLSIEGNTLTEEQITAILDGKRIIGNPKDILEVKNAILLYDAVSSFSKHSIPSFKKAHKILMKGLIKGAGNFRSKNVGILAGSKVKHLAPKPQFVPKLMEDLFEFLRYDPSPILIKSAVAHYEIEFIHPFSDGNGRIGRFWQHVMLVEYNPIFAHIPFESIIQERQKTYYEVLGKCDKLGHSTNFILFCLLILKNSLERFEKENTFQASNSLDRLTYAKSNFANRFFSRKDYYLLCKEISTATASRDLKLGLDEGMLEKSGSLAQTQYKFRK